MPREAVVAGQFYPASSKALKEQIASMTEERGVKEKAIGVVSPHAGYIYSGPVAGALFSRIDIPGTVVILGPNHTGVGAVFSLYEKGSWRTPLGDVDIDEGLATGISKRSESIRKDKSAHSYEHSLEVQIPFMQYFRKDFKIVPIVVGHASLNEYKDVGVAIAEAVKESKKEVLIVASSDMTHYEPREDAERKDKIAIDAVLNLNEELLLKKVGEYNITMCGCIPTAIMLITAKSLGAKSAKLVKYQTSGDTTGDYSAVVGYAGIIVK